MLISNPKPRDIRDGRTNILFLVPELCRATGLTDRQRGNFQMMRAMAEHIQLDPERRKNRLIDFTRRIHLKNECKQVLLGFDTDLDQQLITFPGRELKQETMVFGKDKT